MPYYKAEVIDFGESMQASPATASSEVAEVGVDKKDELQATPQRNPTEMSNFEKSVGMSDGLRRRNEPAQRSTVK